MALLKHVDFEVPGFGEFAAAPIAHSGYAAEVLLDHPAGYWRLGESTGLIAFDELGANDLAHGAGVTPGANGLIIGDPDPAAGYDATAGAASSKSTAVTADLTPRLGQTLEAWVRSDQPVGADYVLSYMSDANHAYFLRVASGGKAQVGWIVAGTSYGAQTASIVIPTGAVRHVVATLSPTGVIAIYIDGIAQTTAASGTFIGGVGVFAIGARGNGNTQTWNGTIDEAAVYSHVLSASRITDHFNAGVGVWA